MKTFTRVVCFGLVCLVAANGQGHNYGQSMVIAQQGIAATSQTLASQAGAQIIARGGSAVDAAIAANAVLAVTEPMKNGLGGDLFVLYGTPQRETHRSECVRRRHRRFLLRFLPRGRQDHARRPAFTASLFPARWRAGAKIHERFGKLPWKDLFQDAIAYAEKGFPVAEAIAEAWTAGQHQESQANSESTRVFLPGGKPPHEGELFRNPDMAHALRLIAEQGPGRVL